MIEKISNILELSEKDTINNSKKIDENLTYYWNPIRGGTSLIVDKEENYLSANSSVNYDKLLEEDIFTLDLSNITINRLLDKNITKVKQLLALNDWELKDVRGEQTKEILYDLNLWYDGDDTKDSIYRILNNNKELFETEESLNKNYSKYNQLLKNKEELEEEERRLQMKKKN